jgi:RNA polymerase sigma-70 factor (ECF subfamily)
MAILRPRRQQRASHEALIRTLYEEHGKALLAYATRMTGDRLAAEDIVQETLIRAWQHPEVIGDPERPMRGWLLTVARNIITDRHRAKAARPTEVAENDALAPVQQDHAQAVVDSMVLLDALERLAPHHREVLVELYYRGRTAPETADRLGIPEGTVKSRAHYALRTLRELYVNASVVGTRRREVAV